MISRRSLMVGSLSVVAGCRKPSDTKACTDVTGLSAEDVSTRARTGYVDRSPDKDRGCADCLQYVAAPSDEACGACKVLKGPVHPRGTCRLFAKKS